MKTQMILHFAKAAAVIAAITVVSAPVLADQKLATEKNCMACHAMAKKMVGPSYTDVAAKYSADKEAVSKLAGKIIAGGSGVWGPVPMPANAQVTADEAKKLAAWIMTVK